MTISEAVNILGIPYNYTEKDLKEAYKNKIREVHPDLNPQLKNAKEKSQQVNEAYTLLKKRGIYGSSNNQEYNEVSSFYNHKQMVICNLYLKDTNSRFDCWKYMDDEFYLTYKEYLDNISDIYMKTIKDLEFCRNNNSIDILLYGLKISINYEIKEFIKTIYKKYFDTNKNIFMKNYSRDRILLKILIDNLNNKCKEYIENFNNSGIKELSDAMNYFIKSKDIILKDVLIKSKVERYLYKKIQNTNIDIEAINILNELDYMPKNREIKKTVKRLIKGAKF